MALSGTVFIDRANRKNAFAAFDSAVKEIQNNKQSVWIFPEGTRSYFNKPDLLPFKKGAFHLAVQAGVPIVPVVVQNYSHVLHLQNRTFEPGMIKIKVRIIRELGFGYESANRMQVLEPIDTKALTSADINDLVINTRERMLKELQSFTVEDVKKNE